MYIKPKIVLKIDGLDELNALLKKAAEQADELRGNRRADQRGPPDAPGQNKSADGGNRRLMFRIDVKCSDGYGLFTNHKLFILAETESFFGPQSRLLYRSVHLKYVY